MLRVLLVDDEPLVKAAFRKLIPWEEQGFQIVGTASNGQEALRLLETCPADILITDLKMPQMDGIALIKALRRAQFQGVILVLSNYADFELVREALVAGAMDYMLKVNLNADNLLGQLQNAREALATRQESHRQERLAAEHGAVLRAHALRAYLLTEEMSGEEASPALLEGYDPPAGPFGLCDIFFLPQARGASSHLPSVSHVESVLRAIFEDVPDTDILILGDRELCCVYPLPALSTKGLLPQDKHQQITRQIGMYFNTQVLLLTPQPAGALADLRIRRGDCLRAAALAFYTLPALKVDPADVTFAGVPAAFPPEEMVGRLAEQYVRQGEDAVQEELTAFFDTCRAARTAPAAVAAFLSDTAEQLLAYTPAAGEREACRQELQTWSACPDERILFAQVLAQYERILAQIIPPAFAHCRESVRNVLLYVHLHYADRITLDDIAREASLERSYLCRLFKRETGHNLFSYLNQLRMNAAARMIEDGDAYIREISGRVGIEDPFYFTRLFKKHFGVNPSEYRNTLV